MAETKKDEKKAQPEPAPVADAVELIRKISPKTVCGRVAIPLKPDGTPYVDEDGVPTKFPQTQLYIAIGRAHGTRTGTGDNGSYCAFLGSFEATRTKDGKKFQAGQCFVPKAVEDLLAASLYAAQETDPKATVEFAIEVGIKYPTTGRASATGYEFYVNNLVKPSGADPLEALRLRVAALPQLAAPTA